MSSGDGSSNLPTGILELLNKQTKNISTGSVESTGDRPIEFDVPLTVFRLLTCVIGIIGNFLAIFVIIVLAEYKNAITSWYVLQLAIADTLFLLTIPFKVVEDMKGSWEFEIWMCKAKETILFLNYYSSILFLIVMSIDRYIAVCHGFSDFLQKFRTRFAAFVITGVVWCISLLLCTPVMLYSGVFGLNPTCKCQYKFPNPVDAFEFCKDDGFKVNTSSFDKCVLRKESSDEAGCGNLVFSGQNSTTSDLADSISDNDYSFGEDLKDPEPDVGNLLLPTDSAAQLASQESLNQGCHYLDAGPGFIAFILFNFIVMFLLPFLVMTACYTLIILRLKKTKMRKESNNIPSTNTNSQEQSAPRKRAKSAAAEKDSKNRRRVTVMCACLVIVFLICWVPFHSVHLAKMQGIRGETKFCGTLFSVVSLIAYINSAINPFLYNFIGTKFGKKLRTAGSIIRKPFVKGAASVSETFAVRYRKGKTHGKNTSETGLPTSSKQKSESRTGDASSNAERVLEDTRN